MHRKIISWLIAALIIMIGLPFLTVSLVKGDSGMAVCFILFYAVNPICSIFTGIFAVWKGRCLWYLPIILSLLFMTGVWLCFDFGEPLFLIYALIYCCISFISMLAAMLVSKFHKNKQS